MFRNIRIVRMIIHFGPRSLRSF